MKRIALELSLYGDDFENENLVTGTTFWLKVKKIPEIGKCFDLYSIIPKKYLYDPEIHDYILDYDECVVTHISDIQTDDEGEYVVVTVESTVFQL